MNEERAIKDLRNLAASQSIFQATAKVDVDNDGIGEFAVFQELSGADAVRTAADGSNAHSSRLNPAILGGSYRVVNANGEASRAGYLFKVFLPGADGLAQEEGMSSGVLAESSAIDSDLAETTWCAYAWPANYGTSGNRTFFVTTSVTLPPRTTAAAPGPARCLSSAPVTRSSRAVGTAPSRGGPPSGPSVGTVASGSGSSRARAVAS